MITVAITLCENSVDGRHKAGRALLRAMTAPLITEPDDAEIITLSGGKPAPLSGRYGFSLSHSGAFACCAVASPTPLCFKDAPFVFTIVDNAEPHVGVDVEVLRDLSPEKLNGIEQRFFSPEERQFSGGNLSRFFEIHTKKEALCKLTGEGLSGYKKAAALTSPSAEIHTRHVELNGERLVLSVAFYKDAT